MIYSFDINIVDLLGLCLAVFITGMMAGHHWLPVRDAAKKDKEIFELKYKLFCSRNNIEPLDVSGNGS